LLLVRHSENTGNSPGTPLHSYTNGCIKGPLERVVPGNCTGSSKGVGCAQRLGRKCSVEAIQEFFRRLRRSISEKPDKDIFYATEVHTSVLRTEQLADPTQDRQLTARRRFGCWDCYLIRARSARWIACNTSVLRALLPLGSGDLC
jgi:hypothetical protein